MPTSVSAIKVDGVRSYARVRAGEDVDAGGAAGHRAPVRGARPPRRRWSTDVAVVDLDVVVECSSGTYVRALARDLGAALGSRRAPDRAAADPGRSVRRWPRPQALEQAGGDRSSPISAVAPPLLPGRWS